MKKIYYISALAMAMLTSCEKELNMNYHNIDPLYVVEANLTSDGATAKISQTLNIKDTLWNKSVEDAVITITGEDGSFFTLHHDSLGNYSSSEACGIPGKEYTIRIQVGDYVSEASSVMQENFNVDDNYLYKISMMSEDAFCYRVDINDEGTKRNYYYALLTRNGKPYKWEVIDNRGFYGTTEIDLGCFIDCEMEDHKEDILNDGDVLDIEIRKIDEKTYDYYVALALAEETYSNPICNFNNKTLGYFSACNVSKLPSITFNKEKVEYLEARDRDK